MNLYLVARTDDWSYEDYDAFIVAAETEEEARNTHPNYNHENPHQDEWEYTPSWVPKENLDSLTVTLIGKSEYITKQVILTSFNSG